MRTWAGYAEEGKACLLERRYDRLGELVNANFDLRAQIYQIDKGNLEMVNAARKAGATSNFAGSGGAIVGTYQRRGDVYQRLTEYMRPLGVMVIKPKIVA